MNSPTIAGIPNRISSRNRRQAKDLERHRRRCIVCNHPERAAIEEEFFHWRNVWEIGRQYQLVDYRTIYRHARATGLHLERRENLHSALDCIVEWSEDVRPTGDVILRAMRAYSCIDSHGRWTDPPRQVHFTSFPGARPTSPGGRPTSPPSNHAARPANPAAPHPNASASSNFQRSPSRSDATFCAASPAQASEPTDDPSQSDEPQPCGSRFQPRHQTASRSDTTACAASPAQAFVDGIETDDPAEPNGDSLLRGLEPEDDPSRSDQPLPSFVGRGFNRDNNVAPPCPDAGRGSDPTACAASPAQVFVGEERADAFEENQKTPSQSDATFCADSPAQFFVDDAIDEEDLDELDGDEDLDPDFDDDADDLEEDQSQSDAAFCAASPAQASEPTDDPSPSDEPQPCRSRFQPRHQAASRSDTSGCQESMSPGDTTACAVSPAQASVGVNRADAVEAEVDEAAVEKDEAADAAEFDEEENNASRSEQPLPSFVGRGLDRDSNVASPSDEPPPCGSRLLALTTEGQTRHETESRSDITACLSRTSRDAASPAQPAPPAPERSPYYTELLITSAPKHPQAPSARPDTGTVPPEIRRASPAERRDADLRRALPHPPDPSQPLQAHHYRELLDRCLDPVAARTLGQVGRRPTPPPVGRRTRQRRDR